MGRVTRSRLAPVDEVGIYHCYDKTIDDHTLCGIDPKTQVDYSSRRIWITELLQLIASSMMIEIFRFSLMRNHFHLLVRTRPDLSRQLSDQEVVTRMVALCPTCLLRRGERPTPKIIELRIKEALDKPDLIDKYRRLLCDISWAMKIFKQYIAKRCNKELKRPGTYFQGRFKSNRLENAAAVLACALYIDLNPIRAGCSDSLEESFDTSIYLQIIGRMQRAHRANEAGVQLPFDGDLWLDTAFADPADADAWLAPMALDPEHRLHHQVQRWRSKGAVTHDRDLTGDDGIRRDFLKLVQEFEWVVGQQAASNPVPDGDSWDGYDPKKLTEVTELFERFLENYEQQKVAVVFETSSQLMTAPDSHLKDSETPSAPKSQTATSSLADSTSTRSSIAMLDANANDGIHGVAAGERALAERNRRQRMVIASCRRKLEQIVEVPEQAGSCSLDGVPSQLSKRVIELIQKCKRYSATEIVESNQSGNRYPCRRASNKGFLPITGEEYMVLLDQTGRIVRGDKPGVIPKELPPILERLGLKSSGWFSLMVDFEKHFKGIVGTVEDVTRRQKQLNHRKIHGLAAARKFFESVALDTEQLQAAEVPPKSAACPLTSAS